MIVKLFPVCDCLGEHNRSVGVHRMMWQDITRSEQDQCDDGSDRDDPSTGITVDSYFVCTVCKKRWREEIIAS